jgi:hypothetical protein
MDSLNLRERVLNWLQKEKPQVFEKYKDNVEQKGEQISVNNNNGISEEDQNALAGLISVYFSQNPE